MENNKVVLDTFKWLFIGLIVCFASSFICEDERIFYLVYGSFHNLGYIIFIIAELVIAIALSAFIRKLNPIVAKILYILYTGLTGICLTGIFLIYTASSISLVFLTTAVMFGVFYLIGRFTKSNLNKLGTYLFIALISIIVLEIINLFILNNTLNMILCIVTILVFCGYIAYDTRKLFDENFLADTENKGIYCAFQLFLDFINIFIELLRIFGKSRD